MNYPSPPQKPQKQEGNTNNDGIWEIDVTIYDDYPVYLMENARDLDNFNSVDDYADKVSSSSSSRPSNKFN